MPLVRNHLLREDADWIDGRLHSARAKLLPVWRDHNLFLTQSPAACFINQPHAQDIIAAATELIYLGDDTVGDAVFAADLSDFTQAAATALVTVAVAGGDGANDRDGADDRHDDGNEIAFLDLRICAPSLPATDAAILGYARGIAHWHRQHPFCSACGGQTHSGNGGYLRRCENAKCAREVFPRINPAVIMLVEQLAPEDGVAKCLLGCNRRWRQNRRACIPP